MFSEGQIAMWEAGDWNTTTLKTSVTWRHHAADRPGRPG
jgi:hypothetical protein